MFIHTSKVALILTKHVVDVVWLIMVWFAFSLAHFASEPEIVNKTPYV